MQFLTKLPVPLAKEALVLLRRLEFLRSIALDDSHASRETLSDVSDLQDFMYHYFNAYDTSVCKFVMTYEKWELDKAMGNEE
jgi:hypothetical protein